MPTTRRPSGLPTQTSQSHLFAVSSERSSGPLSNSRRSYFEHHLRIHSSTRFCMESLDAPLQSRVRRVATTYFLRPRDAQLFHFLRGQQEQICHGLLLVAHSQGYFQGGHCGISHCRAYHEDIDAYFSYLSKLLKQKNTYVLADLMKAFMDSQKSAVFILEFV
jgi:hypothetical protein